MAAVKHAQHVNYVRTLAEDQELLDAELAARREDDPVTTMSDVCRDAIRRGIRIITEERKAVVAHRAKKRSAS
jgi:hypothetical protein